MNYFYLAAGGLAAFALVLHLMLGRSRPMAPPRPGLVSPQETFLLADAWYGRHATTLLLGAMMLGFAYASRAKDAADLAAMLSALAVTFALVRLALAVQTRRKRFDLPEWGLLFLAGALGAAGVYAS